MWGFSLIVRVRQSSFPVPGIDRRQRSAIAAATVFGIERGQLFAARDRDIQAAFVKRRRAGHLGHGNLVRRGAPSKLSRLHINGVDIGLRVRDVDGLMPVG